MATGAQRARGLNEKHGGGMAMSTLTATAATAVVKVCSCFRIQDDANKVMDT